MKFDLKNNVNFHLKIKSVNVRLIFWLIFLASFFNWNRTYWIRFQSSCTACKGHSACQVVSEQYPTLTSWSSLVLSLVAESLSRVFTSNLRTKIPYSACTHELVLYLQHMRDTLPSFPLRNSQRKWVRDQYYSHTGSLILRMFLMAHTSFEVYIVFEIFH